MHRAYRDRIAQSLHSVVVRQPKPVDHINPRKVLCIADRRQRAVAKASKNRAQQGCRLRRKRSNHCRPACPLGAAAPRAARRPGRAQPCRSRASGSVAAGTPALAGYGPDVPRRRADRGWAGGRRPATDRRGRRRGSARLGHVPGDRRRPRRAGLPLLAGRGPHPASRGREGGQAAGGGASRRGRHRAVLLRRRATADRRRAGRGHSRKDGGRRRRVPACTPLLRPRAVRGPSSWSCGPGSAWRAYGSSMGEAYRSASSWPVCPRRLWPKPQAST